MIWASNAREKQHRNDENERVFKHFRMPIAGVCFLRLQQREPYFLVLISYGICMHLLSNLNYFVNHDGIVKNFDLGERLVAGNVQIRRASNSNAKCSNLAPK